MKTFIKLSLFFLIFLGSVLMSAGKTDADLIAEKKQVNNSLSATTLSFSNRNTANFDLLTWFFTTEHLRPGGFEIKSIKIQQDGKMNFKYVLQTELKNTDKALCEALEVKILQDWESIYTGKLTDAKFDRTISTDRDDDLVFMIRMTQDNEGLKNKQCDFNFNIQTWKNNPDEEKKGLWAQKTLQNSIKTGYW